jgi:two-component system copper resistance phosphate regulon response regulator CusR
MNILIIENQRSLAYILEAVLKANGADTIVTKQEELNVQGFKNAPELFDVIILNVSVGVGNKMVEKIRKVNKTASLLGVSTTSTWKEKVQFLNDGGDDVLDYPFPMQELMARINALTRRKEIVEVKKSVISSRRREYTLLEYMIRNKNRNTISK